MYKNKKYYHILRVEYDQCSRPLVTKNVDKSCSRQPKKVFLKRQKRTLNGKLKGSWCQNETLTVSQHKFIKNCHHIILASFLIWFYGQCALTVNSDYFVLAIDCEFLEFQKIN